MKTIFEKEALFTDKGKVKVYQSLLGIPAVDTLYSFQKTVVLTHGRESIQCAKGLDYIFIMLSGTLEISGTGLQKQSVLADTVMVASGEIKKISFTNNSEADAEFLLITVKKAYFDTAGSFKVLQYKQTGKNLALMPVYSTDSDRSTGCSIAVTKAVYNTSDDFSYQQKESHNLVYLYIISGKVNINGHSLLYNDAAIFAGAGEDILADFGKTTEILIIELPV